MTTYTASTYGGRHGGMRTAPAGNTAYRLRGDRGVELTLVDGRRIFIGSPKPAELGEILAQLR